MTNCYFGMIKKRAFSIQELRLERNSLTRVPSGTLKEPKTLQRLNLDHNSIGTINRTFF